MAQCEKRLQTFIADGFKEIKNEIVDVKNSQIFIASQYDEMIKKLDEIANLKIKVDQLEKVIKEKDQVIESIGKRLNQLEQYTRNKNIEIRGVKKVPEEKTEEVVIKYANILNVNLCKDEIEAYHRVPNQTGKEQTIILQLNSKKKREEMLSKKKIMVSNQQLIGQGEGRIYMGENLSPYFKDLLWKSKQMVGDYYKFIWFWKGRILIKKDEQSRANTLYSLADLEKMKPGIEERKLNKEN